MAHHPGDGNDEGEYDVFPNATRDGEVGEHRQIEGWGAQLGGYRFKTALYAVGALVVGFALGTANGCYLSTPSGANEARVNGRPGLEVTYDAHHIKGITIQRPLEQLVTSGPGTYKRP